jgi:hypothetical protein
VQPLRGYRQLNLGTDANGHNTVVPAGRPWHLGPVVLARRGRPVRVKFINQLPTGRAGELFLPVDPTVEGAGPGPLDGPAPYPQNRAVLRLAGAHTGWISAGNPWQWVTPAGEITPYPNGVGLTHVPDMPPPGAGATTLYYPNEQSGRLCWFHDNTVGLARLTVYSGQLALYLLTDPAEEELVADGVLPADQLCRTTPSSPGRTRPGTGTAGARGAACGTRTSTSPGRIRTGPTGRTRPAGGTTARGRVRPRRPRRRSTAGRPTPARCRTRTTTRSPTRTSRR